MAGGKCHPLCHYLSPSQIEQHVATYQRILLETWEEMPPYFITSSESKLGKEEVLNYIEQINQSIQ